MKRSTLLPLLPRLPRLPIAPVPIRRRILLAGAAGWPLSFAGPPVRAVVESEALAVPAYKAFLNGRTAEGGRLTLDIPRIADNGNVVPVKLAMRGPFSAGAEVRSVHLFSEKNPVPQMAVFHFPVPTSRIEIESRVRLAGTQRLAAVATLADGRLFSAWADVTVTVSACLDGS